MEPLFALVVVVLLVLFSSESDEYSGNEKPYTLERNGRYITIRDKHSNHKMVQKFVSAEEASHWYLLQNEYLEDPRKSSTPRRCFYLTRR